MDKFIDQKFQRIWSQRWEPDGARRATVSLLGGTLMDNTICSLVGNFPLDLPLGNLVDVAAVAEDGIE